MHRKKLIFLTGTRADFGKLKSLIAITQGCDDFEVHIFATGMHMNSRYGKTIDEITKAGFCNVHPFINHNSVGNMDRILAKTIEGFSHFIAEIEPDLIVVHGDRAEALAGAIVGSMNNILVAHIEGGEISGTIDELIRHAVSKMSHVHFVANEKAKKRLIQLGEKESSVFIIGSPDIDLMTPSKLPDIKKVKDYYDIPFQSYGVAMFHPVTTEFENIKFQSQQFVNALIASNRQYVVIYPNNDLGSDEILAEYHRFVGNENFKVFPSLRFEYFLSILRDCNFIIGNSSAGIREAPFYGIPTIDIGSRQKNRISSNVVKNCGYAQHDILSAIAAITGSYTPEYVGANHSFGQGNSDQLFYDLVCTPSLWNIEKQKQLQDIVK